MENSASNLGALSPYSNGWDAFMNLIRRRYQDVFADNADEYMAARL